MHHTFANNALAAFSSLELAILNLDIDAEVKKVLLDEIKCGKGAVEALSEQHQIALDIVENPDLLVTRDGVDSLRSFSAFSK